MITLMWLFYVTIVFYSIVDATQTIVLLNMGMTELNPILNWFIIKTGTVYSIFMPKILWLGFLLMFLIFKTKEELQK